MSLNQGNKSVERMHADVWNGAIYSLIAPFLLDNLGIKSYN